MLYTPQCYPPPEFSDLLMWTGGVQALSSIVGSLSLPSAAILEWLDSHVQVRMSILFAYMFGKSQLCAQLLTWLAQTWAPIRAALNPLFVVLGCAPAYHLLIFAVGGFFDFVAPYTAVSSLLVRLTCIASWSCRCI